MKTSIVSFLATAALLANALGHGHINAGAADTNGSGGINAGDKLFMYFEHGTANTPLAYNGGANAYGADGFFWNGYTTFTALHQSTFPDQAPNYNSLGAVSGSFLNLQLLAVDGPTGARFAFYDEDATDPLWVYEIGAGFVSGSGMLALTEQSWFDGSPGDGIPSDPFGHIHGRMFGSDAAGVFTATWVIKDVHSSTTGLLDSDPFVATYTASAIPEPASAGLVIAAVAAAAAGRTLRRRAMVA